MKNPLIYENLDTSFVNLAALVRFLRARKFAGSVRIELGEYKGEIFFTANDEVHAREHDRISGRVAEGEEALQRLLIRAREPGGTIDVHQTIIDSANVTAENAAADLSVNNRDEMISQNNLNVNLPRRDFAPSVTTSAANVRFSENQNSAGQTTDAAYDRMIFETKTLLKSPETPLEFSNKVEAKAKQNQLSESDWRTLLHHTAELLHTIDASLAKNNLNFAAAFQKACAETASDYPFLDPAAGILVYRGGQVEMREQVNAKLFAAAINETLRRILEKLAANPKFAEPYRETTQKILALIRERRPLYDQFFITPQLEKILGV